MFYTNSAATATCGHWTLERWLMLPCWTMWLRLYRSNLFPFQSQKIWWKIKTFTQEKCIFAHHTNTKSFPVPKGPPKLRVPTKGCMCFRCFSKHNRCLPRTTIWHCFVLPPLSLDLYHLYSLGEETLGQPLSQCLMFLEVKKDLSAGCVTVDS